MKFLEQTVQQIIKTQPVIWEAPEFNQLGKRAIFYSGLDNFRNFAWIGLPENASCKNKVPGMVLVHGGGGSAFAHWVDYWTKQGYAVIAMDTCGAMPDTRNLYNNWPRHSYSSPAGWGAFDEQLNRPPEQQWFPHAVTAIINAATVLSALPEVDSARIGITGISWGGVLTCIAAGLDPRFKAVCPVYGCGYLTEESCWVPQFSQMTPKQFRWWKNQWDPANFLSAITAPVLWFNGTNDFAFFPSSWQKSADKTRGLNDYCMKVLWPHAHQPGEKPKEILAFFNQHLRGMQPRIRITNIKRGLQTITGKVSSKTILAANLCFTADSGDWPEREWLTIPAVINGDGITAALPQQWQAAYLSVISTELLTSTSKIIFCD
jgi:dienelactone hydrolase